MDIGDAESASAPAAFSLLANGRTIGEGIEEVVCYGSLQTLTLTSEDRASVVEFAASFEECSSTREELHGMVDGDLVRTAYWAMAEYARGQV